MKKENVTTERNKYQKGVFYPGFFVIGMEKKLENFKNNMDNQKVNTLVLTVKTQNLCSFMSMTENNSILGSTRGTPIKRWKSTDAQRKQ